MPYIPSPMENFNKSNPFIILAKKEYDIIMDTIQEFSKNALVRFVVIGVLELVLLIMAIIEYAVFHDAPKVGMLAIIILILGIMLGVSYYTLHNKIKWYMAEHPAMVEFDRLAALEVNAIIALQNEDILKALHGMYGLTGALEVDTKYFIQRLNYMICIAGGTFLAYIIFMILAIIH